MNRSLALISLALLAATTSTDAFMVNIQKNQPSITTSFPSSRSAIILQASFASRNYARGNKSDRGGNGNSNKNSNNYRRSSDRTKRQERVGTLVQTELSRIIHKGVIRGEAEYLDDDLRQRISIVSADVSPDLKQARISISVRGPNKRNIVEEDEEEDDDENIENNEEIEDDEEGEVELDEDELAAMDGALMIDIDMEFEDYDDDDDDEYDDDEYIEDANDATVDQRRAYSWLVRNTKPIRHTLAQRMSHMKSCPDLTFVQVDVAAATDVMYLIDKVAKGYKRERVGGFNDNDMPTGVLSGMDFDENYDEEDWEEEKGDDFFSK